MPEDFLTVEEAASALARSVPTIWRLIRKHKLQTFKRPMDRRTYVRRGDLEGLTSEFTPRHEEP